MTLLSSRNDSVPRSTKPAFVCRVFTAIVLGMLSVLGTRQGSTQVPTQPQAASSASGQQPDTPGTYTLQVNAQAVVLDVVVTDKDGKPVYNLTRDDFQIFEDKVPQTIRSLDSPEVHTSAAKIPINSTADLDKQEPSAPVTILVLDEVNTRFEDEIFARYSLKKFLDTQGDMLSQPTLFIAVDMNHFMMLHDYTTSKQEILTALDHHLAAYPWHQQGGAWKAEQFNAAIASIMEIAEATSGHPGHKGMIWIGRGFPTFNPDTLSPEAAASLKSAIETCTNALRDARVVLYTLDPAGVSTQPIAEDENEFYEEDPFGGDVDFNEMAMATGGASFFGRNDVDKLIAASARDADSFYTLSYRPQVPITDTKTFHNIRVVMRNPKWHAVTRAGYYPQFASTSPAAGAQLVAERKVFDLTVAAQSTMVYDAVPLTVSRLPGEDDFKVSLSSSDIVWQPSSAGKLKGDVTLVVECFDKRGKMLHHVAQTSTLQVLQGPNPNAPATPFVALQASIPTEAPAARVRFVVRVDGSGKLGSANLFLVDEKSIADPAMGVNR